MSFRLPRGPKLVTLFHDAQSPASQRVLKVLQTKLNIVNDSQQKTEGAKQDYNERSRVKVYLEEAASSNIQEREPLFELEIVERSRATADQWRTIASYLKQSTKPGNQEIELKQSKIEALKDESGPIVIDWDDGLAARTQDEVDELIQKLIKENQSKIGSKGGIGCEIM